MNEKTENYALGNLSPGERKAMDEARRFDAALDRAIRDAEDRLAPLSLAAESECPPPALRDRVEAAIDAENAAIGWRLTATLDEGDWQPVTDGVEFKWLWNERTQLLRCAPGAVLPSHVHEDEEHLVVLSGDLVIGGRTFTSGDYIGSRRGVDRFPHMTRHGCLILSQLGH